VEIIDEQSPRILRETIQTEGNEWWNLRLISGNKIFDSQEGTRESTTRYLSRLKGNWETKVNEIRGRNQGRTWYLYVSLSCSSKIYGSFQSISGPMPKPKLWYQLKRPRTLMGTESPGYVFVRSKNILTSTLRLKNSVNNNSQLHNNVLLQEYTYNHEK